MHQDGLELVGFVQHLEARGQQAAEVRLPAQGGTVAALLRGREAFAGAPRRRA